MFPKTSSALQQQSAVAHAGRHVEQLLNLPPVVKAALIAHGYTSTRQILASPDAALIDALYWTPNVGTKSIASFKEWLAEERRLAGNSMAVVVDVKVSAEIAMRRMREQLASELISHMKKTQVQSSELARLAATSETAVMDLLRGEPPSIEVLMRMAVALGLHIEVSTTVSGPHIVCDLE